MKSQWIFYGTEGGGWGGKYYITEEMEEQEFLERYGVCVSVVGYYPVNKITMEKIQYKKEKFNTKEKRGQNETINKSTNTIFKRKRFSV